MPQNQNPGRRPRCGDASLARNGVSHEDLLVGASLSLLGPRPPNEMGPQQTKRPVQAMEPRDKTAMPQHEKRVARSWHLGLPWNQEKGRRLAGVPDASIFHRAGNTRGEQSFGRRR